MNPHKILPEFPRMIHLPWKPNTERNDLVASEEDASVIFDRTPFDLVFGTMWADQSTLHQDFLPLVPKMVLHLLVARVQS